METWRFKLFWQLVLALCLTLTLYVVSFFNLSPTCSDCYSHSFLHLNNLNNKHLHVASNPPSPLRLSREISVIKLDWCSSGTFTLSVRTGAVRAASVRVSQPLETSPVSFWQYQWCFNSPLMACPLPLLGGSRVSAMKRKTSPDDTRWRALLFSHAVTQIRRAGLWSNTIFIIKLFFYISLL